MHDAALEAAFGDAAPEHFAWTTRGAGVAENERELCRQAFLPLGRRLLDLGCGEGATLFHLGSPADAVGVDLFPKKVAFAQQTLPSCRFVAASVYELPFEAASFDHLIVRDVIHHLERPSDFINECARVLAPGGRIDVLEPCRYNPLIAVHALLNEAERGELRSTQSFLRGLLQQRFTLLSSRKLQPMPIHRIVFHPVLGRPALAELPWVRQAVSTLEKLAGKLLPQSVWAYVHVRAQGR
ncbi:MAG TPA: methyltransferase domain-containing protein [Polyangiaceae bacterium]|nr:methyltransferase domain-containing protein [Polyangiaceae bacterium]